jgi:hypothetical protein
MEDELKYKTNNIEKNIEKGVQKSSQLDQLILSLNRDLDQKVGMEEY